MKRYSFTLVMMSLMAAQAAQAVPITFAFTGTVTSVRDDGAYLDGSIVPGIDFSGTYTFESSTPDDYPDMDQLGQYTFEASPELIMTLHLGSYDLVAPLAHIYADNGGELKDRYHVASGEFALVSTVSQMVLDCKSFTQNALDSDALPIEPPDITLFDTHVFGLSAYEWGVSGQITSITPEPQSAMLLLLGCLAACVGKKKH